MGEYLKFWLAKNLIEIGLIAAAVAAFLIFSFLLAKKEERKRRNKS